jgi:predicted flap endonuclease-1-like 5' DNA nuclease
MRKKKPKKSLGKIVQIAATGGDKLFALTSLGEVYERVENEEGFAEWEQISELCPENVAETDVED